MGGVQEIARSKTRLHGVELRVVEEVEVLPAEIQAGSFGECEALEKAEIKVGAARQIQGVASDVSKSKARGKRIGHRIIQKRPRRNGVGICRDVVRVADLVWARARAYAIAYARVVTKGRA